MFYIAHIHNIDIKVFYDKSSNAFMSHRVYISAHKNLSGSK